MNHYTLYEPSSEAISRVSESRERFCGQEGGLGSAWSEEIIWILLSGESGSEPVLSLSSLMAGASVCTACIAGTYSNWAGTKRGASVRACVCVCVRVCCACVCVLVFGARAECKCVVWCCVSQVNVQILASDINVFFGTRPDSKMPISS